MQIILAMIMIPILAIAGLVSLIVRVAIAVAMIPVAIVGALFEKK